MRPGKKGFEEKWIKSPRQTPDEFAWVNVWFLNAISREARAWKIMTCSLLSLRELIRGRFSRNSDEFCLSWFAETRRVIRFFQELL